MSFNGADTAGMPADIIPAATSSIGGSGGETHLTTGDIVVIVVSIAIFFLVVFTVFYVRQLQHRRQRAMELKALDEEQPIGGDEGECKVTELPSLWRFIGWRDPSPEIITACSPRKRGEDGKSLCRVLLHMSELSHFALLFDVAAGEFVWDFSYPPAMNFPPNPYQNRASANLYKQPVLRPGCHLSIIRTR
jgi:hypothetical protein